MRPLAVAIVAIALVFGGWQLSRSTTFQLFGELVARVETIEKVVALTFDDGPSERFTGDVLEMLAREGVVATFYLTGEAAEAYPAGVRSIAEAGHEIGNHSFSHQRMVLMTPAAVRMELSRTDDALRAGGYDGPLTFRPPFGKKLIVLPWVLSEQGRVSVMADVIPDEGVADAQALAEEVVAQVQPGSIVMLHVMFASRGVSREAVPLIIDALRHEGYEFVTVSELLDAAG